MDKADLETYQVQLSQVEQALVADPDNTELKDLRNELKELIELTQAALAQQQAAASSSKAESSRKAAVATATRSWAAGDECLAKYSGDGQWYPARITSVGGSTENRVYSVMFKGYNSTELLNATQLKPLPPNHQSAGPSAGNKRKLSKAEEEERKAASGPRPPLPTGQKTTLKGKSSCAANRKPATQARVPPPAWPVKSA